MNLVLKSPDDLNAKTILTCLEAAGLNATFESNEDTAYTLQSASDPSACHLISLPVRIGAVVDQAQKMEKLSNKPPKEILFGAARFQPEESLFTNAAGETEILTEKEHDLLIALWQRLPNAMHREDLLQEIWGYKTELETHTLETHIYRLRQKIETDPANPKILLTTEGGYKLNLGE